MSTSDEISDDVLKHLARSVTLWEFMMLKVNRGRSSSDRRVRIAEILTEFSELHKKVKQITRQSLTPVDQNKVSTESNAGNKARKTLMLESKDLADCLGLPRGRYEINQSAEMTDSSLTDCRPLIPPMRRRATKPSVRDLGNPASSTVPTTIIDYGASTFELADGSELRQYVIEPSSDADAQSMLQGTGVDGTGQQLVLVAADSGELLLQCDLKDYQNMVQNGVATGIGAPPGYTTFDDVRSLLGLQASVTTATAGPAAVVEGEFNG